MNDEGATSSRVLDAISDRFLRLVRNLVRGNRKRALALADQARRDALRSGLKIASQGLIEDMAQSQALKNSLINSPSVVPGIGTLLSFWLLSVENFFLLDQSVTLVMALSSLNGAKLDDDEALEMFAVQVVGEVLGIKGVEHKNDHRAISREYITKTLPGQYVNSGVTRGVKTLMRRLIPIRANSRLLPVGIGIVASALTAYETLVNVGQTTLKHLPRLIDDAQDGGSKTGS